MVIQVEIYFVTSATLNGIWCIVTVLDPKILDSLGSKVFDWIYNNHRVTTTTTTNIQTFASLQRFNGYDLTCLDSYLERHHCIGLMFTNSVYVYII